MLEVASLEVENCVVFLASHLIGVALPSLLASISGHLKLLFLGLESRLGCGYIYRTRNFVNAAVATFRDQKVALSLEGRLKSR